MKNNIVKFYIAATYFLSTVVMFAQADPGTDTDGAALESTDPAPIGDYLWVLAIIGLVLVYLKFKAIHKKSIQN